MLNDFKEHKEYLFIATILTYGWGLIYHYLFFSTFGIEITNYISLQELLVKTIIQLFFIVIGISLIQFIIFFIAALLARKSDDKEFAKKQLEITLGLDAGLFFILLSFAIFFDSFARIFISFLLPAILIPLLIKVYYASKEYDREDPVVKKLITAFIVFAITLIFTNSACDDGELVKRGESKKEFVYELVNGKIYSSIDDIVYIGETSSAIFLYDLASNNTIILNRNSIIESVLIDQVHTEEKQQKINEKVKKVLQLDFNSDSIN